MNIQKLLNVSPDKLYDLLDLEESKNDNKNNYDVWFYNLKNNNLDISKLLLILKNMDKIQWKNIYIFLYSRWEKTRNIINTKHTIEMKSLPIYDRTIDIPDTIYNFIKNDISLELFFLNTLQIYFVPNPN
tara:strand:+ start:58 stop:447 length:390 start_codon:yes stop_codon:yes gene_type:complete